MMVSVTKSLFLRKVSVFRVFEKFRSITRVNWKMILPELLIFVHYILKWGNTPENPNNSNADDCEAVEWIIAKFILPKFHKRKDDQDK